MKSRLLNLSDSISIDGEEYKINTDFKVWLRIEGLLFDTQTEPQLRLAKILALAYPSLPHDPYRAVQGLVDFYAGGRAEEPKSVTQKGVRCYDVSQDFDYIWGGFLAEYGIDITKADMHWWKFTALLGCLSDQCKFSRIVAYRTVDTSRIRDKELRRFYERMKKRFRLNSGSEFAADEDRVADSLAELF